MLKHRENFLECEGNLLGTEDFGFTVKLINTSKLAVICLVAKIEIALFGGYNDNKCDHR